ncbi:hypothetical protein TNCV_4020391 [Trichonephila clavipes]|nr:hypothetical protein TNCV_4020391 [Trichonephila clavipes]
MAVEIRLGQSSSRSACNEMENIQKEFEQVFSIHIPRWIHTASQQITLHGFCDASELAMHRSSMLCSRKPMVIPR